MSKAPSRTPLVASRSFGPPAKANNTNIVSPTSCSPDATHEHTRNTVTVNSSTNNNNNNSVLVRSSSSNSIVGGGGGGASGGGGGTPFPRIRVTFSKREPPSVVVVPSPSEPGRAASPKPPAASSPALGLAAAAATTAEPAVHSPYASSDAPGGDAVPPQRKRLRAEKGGGGGGTTNVSSTTTSSGLTPLGLNDVGGGVGISNQSSTSIYGSGSNANSAAANNSTVAASGSGNCVVVHGTTGGGEVKPSLKITVRLPPKASTSSLPAKPAAEIVVPSVRTECDVPEPVKKQTQSSAKLRKTAIIADHNTSHNAHRHNSRTPHTRKDPEPEPELESEPLNEEQDLWRRILLSITQDEDADPFLEPVDPVKLRIPDYFDVIKNPMDLSTVLRNLESGKYQKLKQFCSDMDLIFNNAKLYNPPGHAVHVAAQKLQTLFYERVKVRNLLGVKCKANSKGPLLPNASITSDSQRSTKFTVRVNSKTEEPKKPSTPAPETLNSIPIPLKKVTPVPAPISVNSAEELLFPKPPRYSKHSPPNNSTSHPPSLPRSAVPPPPPIKGVDRVVVTLPHLHEIPITLITPGHRQHTGGLSPANAQLWTEALSKFSPNVGSGRKISAISPDTDHSLNATWKRFQNQLHQQHNLRAKRASIEKVDEHSTGHISPPQFTPVAQSVSPTVVPVSGSPNQIVNPPSIPTTEQTATQSAQNSRRPLNPLPHCIPEGLPLPTRNPHPTATRPNVHYPPPQQHQQSQQQLQNPPPYSYPYPNSNQRPYGRQRRPPKFYPPAPPNSFPHHPTAAPLLQKPPYNSAPPVSGKVAPSPTPNSATSNTNDEWQKRREQERLKREQQRKSVSALDPTITAELYSFERELADQGRLGMNEMGALVAGGLITTEEGEIVE